MNTNRPIRMTKRLERELAESKAKRGDNMFNLDRKFLDKHTVILEPTKESLFEKMLGSLRMEGESLLLEDTGKAWKVVLTRNRGENIHVTFAATPWKAVVNMIEKLTQ